jgi:hypothetical protein
MYTQKKINTQRFTVRFNTVANYLGFTRVGQFEKLLKQMHPSNKIHFTMGYARVSALLNELEAFKKGEEE